MFCRACGQIVPKLPGMSWDQWEKKPFCDAQCADSWKNGQRAEPRQKPYLTPKAARQKKAAAGSARSAAREWRHRVRELRHLWLSDRPLNLILRAGWPSPGAFFKGCRRNDPGLLAEFLTAHRVTENEMKQEYKDARQLTAA